jgi:hypothetical protein
MHGTKISKKVFHCPTISVEYRLGPKVDARLRRLASADCLYIFCWMGSCGWPAPRALEIHPLRFRLLLFFSSAAQISRGTQSVNIGLRLCNASYIHGRVCVGATTRFFDVLTPSLRWKANSSRRLNNSCFNIAKYPQVILNRLAGEA